MAAAAPQGGTGAARAAGGGTARPGAAPAAGVASAGATDPMRSSRAARAGAAP